MERGKGERETRAKRGERGERREGGGRQRWRSGVEGGGSRGGAEGR